MDLWKYGQILSIQKSLIIKQLMMHPQTPW
jgi:hypothetical protein